MLNLPYISYKKLTLAGGHIYTYVAGELFFCFCDSIPVPTYVIGTSIRIILF